MAPRTLPHSEESERAVLGGLLLDPRELAAIRSRLEPSDFYIERHQVLYAAMQAVADAGGTVDRLTLQAHLEQAGTWESVGGVGYLVTLDQDLPDLGRLDEYVEIVRDRSTRRALIAASRQAITAAAGPKSSTPAPSARAGPASARRSTGSWRRSRPGEPSSSRAFPPDSPLSTAGSAACCRGR